MGGSQSSENAGKTKLNSKTKQWLESEIRTHQIVVFVKPNCPFCARVKKLFGDLSAPIHIIDITKREDMKQIQDCLQEATGTRTVSLRHLTTNIHTSSLDFVDFSARSIASTRVCVLLLALNL